MNSKTLRNINARAARLKAINEPHMRDLTAYVERLRLEKGPTYEIPYFDPYDGGINARALFLLEAPGPQATGSGFVSRDNPDETAKNVWTMTAEVGLDRKDCIVWNVCPWYVGSKTKIRAVRSGEVKESVQALSWLLKRLDKLQCVALVGRKAQLAKHTVEAAGLNIVIMPHPSPMFVNRAPENRSLVLAGFQAVSDCLKR